MVVLKFYIANVLDQNKHEVALLKAMKSLEYLFKFIIRSRILFAASVYNTNTNMFISNFTPFLHQ